MVSDRTDLPWLLGGCVLALLCSMSAATMMVRATDRPIVNGADHLQIFARPAQIHDERVQEERVRAAQDMSHQPPLDYTPTASIREPLAASPSSPVLPPLRVPAGAPASDPALAPPTFTLLSAARSRATFRGPAGDIVVKRGDAIPGLGRVADIAWRDGGWTVVLSGSAARAR